jgi:hypothetical protein
VRGRGRRMRRRAGANAGNLTVGGALTRRRQPGSDAGAGAAAAAPAAAEEGEGQALVSLSRRRMWEFGSFLVGVFRLVVVCGSLVPFSWGVVGVPVDARSSGLLAFQIGWPAGLDLASRRQL